VSEIPELVYKLNFKVDLQMIDKEITALIDSVGVGVEGGQISLTHSVDCLKENRYSEGAGSIINRGAALNMENKFPIFNSDLNNSYLHWVYKNVPFKVGRMRIMVLMPKRCLSHHADTGPRYHFAVKTTEDAFVIYPKLQKVYHIPADGSLYYMNAVARHTAINANLKESRIHLVFSDFDQC
jgi:hypothetical protein